MRSLCFGLCPGIWLVLLKPLWFPKCSRCQEHLLFSYLHFDPSPWHRDPWNFLGDKIASRSNGATLGGSWVASGRGLVTKRPNPDWKLGNFIPPLILQRGKGLVVELMIGHSCMMMPPQNLKCAGFGELPCRWTLLSTGSGVRSNSMEKEAPVLWTLPDVSLFTSSIGYAFMSFIMPFML